MLHSKYFIEFAAVPTSVHPTQVVSVNQLRGVVELDMSRKDLKFTSDYSLKLNLHGHVIYKLYADTETAREIYFLHGGYGESHISQLLHTLCEKVLPEVLV